MQYSKVIDHPERFDFGIRALGTRSVPSPVTGRPFISDETRIAYNGEIGELRQLFERSADAIPSFEHAGPREKVFFNPAWSRAAIVTCGGLCPGLNDVIKGLVTVLTVDYGVRAIYGVRYGYLGLTPQAPLPPVQLDLEQVDGIHEKGGTILGSSRGDQDIGSMVDTLQNMNINMLFCIGGDGTLRGAHAIAEEIARRGLHISVVGIPKTIDNDLSFIERTFGFETAVYATFDILDSAHMEAKGALNGIGLVKLMGRDSGFIAAYASLANSIVNFCLIPEVPFTLEGEDGLLRALERRFASGKTHSVIVAAEGAGQNLFEGGGEARDASGNLLHKDIGRLLKDRIVSYFKDRHTSCTVKYFDPSYQIRSISAQGTDAIFCFMLAENAVHAAMAGKTDLVIGHWNQRFTHVPIPLAVMERKKLDTDGPLWKAVLTATRQNRYFHPR